MALKTMAAMVDSQKECLDIIFDTAGSFMVKILTVHGQFIKTIREPLPANGTCSVSLSGLSSGAYVANIFKDNSFLRSLRFNKN